MKEIQGNLWDFYNKGFHIAITTNGSVRKDGRAVMGRGTANQALHRMPDLNLMLGQYLINFRNRVMYSSLYKLFTFPVKHKWFEDADPQLIEVSAVELMSMIRVNKVGNVYMPRPGCGNGRLRWDDVKPILIGKFDDRVTIVEINP